MFGLFRDSLLLPCDTDQHELSQASWEFSHQRQSTFAVHFSFIFDALSYTQPSHIFRDHDVRVCYSRSCLEFSFVQFFFLYLISSSCEMKTKKNHRKTFLWINFHFFIFQSFFLLSQKFSIRLSRTHCVSLTLQQKKVGYLKRKSFFLIGRAKIII